MDVETKLYIKLLAVSAGAQAIAALDRFMRDAAGDRPELRHISASLFDKLSSDIGTLMDQVCNSKKEAANATAT